MYVVAIDPDRNAVIVGPESALYARGLIATELHWITGESPGEEFEPQVQIRYRAQPVPTKVELEGGEAQVEFSEPVRAVTPGQAAVFYDGETVLGGGVIDRVLPPVDKIYHLSI